jgi:DNA-directed RNA polymerase specialized sigma24 family protein
MYGHVREVQFSAHITGRNARSMHQIPPLVDKRILRPAQTVLALGLVSQMDLLRLKTIARIYCRGLPPEIAWDDMLQEALTRVIAGSRRQPEGVTMVAFVAGILRSLRAEYWRRAARESRGGDTLRIDHESNEALGLVVSDPAPGPERVLNAEQELAAIKQLFADDPTARKIIDGLRDGLSAEQIRHFVGLSKTDYDSTRRRMRRALLRQGLTCEPR